jgi:hypothetical protein
VQEFYKSRKVLGIDRGEGKYKGINEGNKYRIKEGTQERTGGIKQRNKLRKMNKENKRDET